MSRLPATQEQRDPLTKVAEADSPEVPRTVERALDFLGLHRANAANAAAATLATTSLAISTSISYPAILFSGDLAQYYAAGLGFTLVSAVVLGLTVALLGSYSGSVAYPQSQPLVVMAIIAGTIAAALQTQGLGEQVLPTFFALAVVCSVGSGLFFVLLGKFRYGDLIRYVPFPVVGGFLAAVGWILVKTSLSTTLNVSLAAENLPLLLQYDALLRWLPGIALGAVLWRVQRKRVHYLNLPIALLVSIGLFWLIALAAGRSAAELEQTGWLLGPLPTGALWSPLEHITALPDAAWSLFPGQLVGFATLLALSAISLLLAASSVELAARQDIDLNRELRSIGLANILTGLAGGVPGHLAPAPSILSGKLNAPVRVVGLSTALACLAVLLLGGNVLSMVPKVTVSMMLFYGGLSFLVDWLYRTFFRMVATDYLVLVTVFLVAVLVGFMQGIGVGVVFGVLIFVIKYSRVGAARRVASGSVLHSNVERPDALRKILRESGDQILVITLQGYLFFGTANALLDVVKERIADTNRVRLTHLILDFSLVNGLDSSATASFAKMLQYSEKDVFKVLLANPSEAVATIFRRESLYESQHRNVRVFPDMDRALEWSENGILAARQLAAEGLMMPIEATLDSIFPQPREAAEFRRFLEPRHFDKDELLVEQGTESDDLFFVESGQVMVCLSLPDGKQMRIRTMNAGTVVGEGAFYLGVPRSASVIGVTGGRAYRLSRESLEKLKVQDPHIATTFHEYMARMLADKLADTTRLLSVLKT
jgi:SulP family sulfate permease